MIITDTGPLVSIINNSENKKHVKCMEALRIFGCPMLTTWSCLTEATYLIGRVLGWYGIEKLLDLVDQGSLYLHHPDNKELSRAKELMIQYKDKPMSLADASLVVLAEVSGGNKIFTLDSDFYTYRIYDKGFFTIVPE